MLRCTAQFRSTIGSFKIDGKANFAIMRVKVYGEMNKKITDTAQKYEE
jgi:hypothetical protein